MMSPPWLPPEAPGREQESTAQVTGFQPWQDALGPHASLPGPPQPDPTRALRRVASQPGQNPEAGTGSALPRRKEGPFTHPVSPLGLRTPHPSPPDPPCPLSRPPLQEVEARVQLLPWAAGRPPRTPSCLPETSGHHCGPQGSEPTCGPTPRPRGRRWGSPAR